MEEIITCSSEETESEGEKFSERLKPGDIVFLKGQLGSGKTTFTKGIAKGLGILTRIISPTFIVVREHSVESNKKSPIRTLYHLDMYRLKDEKDVMTIDLKDYIEDKSAVTVIEWPEVGQDIIDREYWNINLIQIGDSRQINISYGK